jgi:hypothetical protein
MSSPYQMNVTAFTGMVLITNIIKDFLKNTLKMGGLPH